MADHVFKDPSFSNAVSSLKTLTDASYDFILVVFSGPVHASFALCTLFAFLCYVCALASSKSLKPQTSHHVL
jgi:hypothetical protein